MVALAGTSLSFEMWYMRGERADLEFGTPGEHVKRQSQRNPTRAQVATRLSGIVEAGITGHPEGVVQERRNQTSCRRDLRIAAQSRCSGGNDPGRHPSAAGGPRPVYERNGLRVVDQRIPVHHRQREGAVPRRQQRLAPVVAVRVGIRQEQSRAGSRKEDGGGTRGGRVKEVPTDARRRHRRGVGAILRQRRRRVQRDPGGGVASHHPRRRGVRFSNHADGRRQEFVVHVTGSGVAGRGDGRDRTDGRVTAGHVRAQQREGDPVRRVGRQEAAVPRPHHFSHARVGSNTGVRSIRRKEEEVAPIGTDCDRPVPYDIGIDGSLAAESTAVGTYGRKGRTDVVFDDDIGTERGGRVLRGRRRSGERDVHVVRSHGAAEQGQWHRKSFDRLSKSYQRCYGPSVSGQPFFRAQDRSPTVHIIPKRLCDSSCAFRIQRVHGYVDLADGREHPVRNSSGKMSALAWFSTPT